MISSAPHRSSHGRRSRISRRSAEFCVGSRCAKCRVQSQQFPLRSRQRDIGELVLGADKRQACHANLDKGHQLDEKPRPAKVLSKRLGEHLRVELELGQQLEAPHQQQGNDVIDDAPHIFLGEV